MHPILYILQNDQTSFRQKIDIALLEILFHFFTCFEPSVIYPLKKEESLFAKIRASSKKIESSSRHSRFLPNFLKKDSRGVNKLSHKVFET